MKEKKITTQYTVFEGKNGLPEGFEELLQEAKKAANNAYAPYSNFKVGAAVRLDDGQIITGNNQEISSYPAGLCAERVALFAAAAHHPDKTINAIAITIKTDKNIQEPIAPCGSCRQVLAEMEHRFKKDIKIIMQGEEGEVWVINSVKNILPFSFSSKYLNV